MSSAAFSMPSGSPQPISLQRGTVRPATATSSAADDAIRRVIDQRRRRNAGLAEPQPQASALEGAIESVTSAIGGSIAQRGLPQWAFRAAVLGAVAIVLGGAVVSIAMRAPTLHSVDGLVLFGAVPVPQSRISFHLLGPAAADAQPLAFTTGKDGSFRSEGEPAIPAGLYAVTVDAVPRNAKALPPIPKTYRDPGTSPLRVQITENLSGLKLLIRR
jgi:hypothetical protein